MCDGTSNHVGHGDQRFFYEGKTAAQLFASYTILDNPFNPPVGAMTLNPATTKTLDIKPNCDNPKFNSTICDSRLRTANTQAECGSLQDFYFYR